MPLLRVAIVLIAGMDAGRMVVLWDGAPQWLIPSVWLLLMLLSVGIALISSRKPITQGCAILAAVFFLGTYLMADKMRSMDVRLSDEEVIYKAVVLTEPVERGKIVGCDLLITTGEYANRKVRASILRDTVNHYYRLLHVGDGILASSVLEEPANYQPGFDYAAYLKNNGFVASTFIYWSDWQKAVVSLTGLSLVERTRLAALSFRQRILSAFGNSGLDNQDYAVVIAMTLGDKRLLDRETREMYSVSGASHVLALSGLHLGIIYMALSLIFFRRRRVLTECLLLLAIWAYVFIVGMHSSVVRAAIMITIYGITSLANRDRMSLNTLSLAAILMLLANPLQLFDVGFQLSFAAVAGIVSCYKPLYALLPLSLRRYQFIKYVWGLTVVSLCAQVATAPIVAYYFGRFSCYGLLTNFAVIPLATAILYVAVVLLLLLWIPGVKLLLMQLLTGLANLLNTILAWISRLPGASIENITISPLQVLLLYVSIICFLAAAVRYSNSLVKKRGV